MREEEVKNHLRKDFFASYDADPIIGNIDFAVAVPRDGQELFETEYLLWAESKKGSSADIKDSFVQLILTIGKERTFDHYLPPAFLGAFDAEKIAFIPYNSVLDVFYQNDFNWKVAPSDHNTKEFQQIKELVAKTLEEQMLIFSYDRDRNDLQIFIKNNFKVGKSEIAKIRINKNNFTHIYQKWISAVKPSIAINWDEAKKEGLIDADFYLADILSKNNASIKDKLFVLLKADCYVYNIHRKATGAISYESIDFNDGQKAHTQFWNRYTRPPKRDYWDYIVERRDLLVPQDIRERKGSYFTPKKWVELSQQYIANELGEDWQDEYVVWDCAAGTGNLLNGLTNKYNIWASTLDSQDVKAMQDRITAGSLNLLESHVFQFDFLNDPFTKLPPPLREIIENEDKRKKLVIYINPPYAEAGNRKVIAAGGGKQKTNVAVNHLTYKTYLDFIGIAGRELFAQFLIRIYKEIPSSVLAEFSKLKILQAPNFKDFRSIFRAKLGRFFCVPANTFDNVKGKFPIGFHIWHTSIPEPFIEATADIFNAKGEFIGNKIFSAFDNAKSINDWIIETRNQPKEIKIGYMSCRSHDVSNINYNYIMNDKTQMKSPRGSWVTDKNLQHSAIYIAVCHCFSATWLNDRDQFLYPNDGWKDDKEFQTDCLIYTLFSSQNRISANDGINHWIPFTEKDVDSSEKFKSHFMSDYLSGNLTKFQQESQGDLFNESPKATDCFIPINHLSSEAQDVLNAGRELWKYYHSKQGVNPDASLYDIKRYFQGVSTKKNGREIMNSDSLDGTYMNLRNTLSSAIKSLAAKINPKIYEYGFLKQ